MKRIPIAIKAFVLILFTKDLSLKLKFNQKELNLEEGMFLKNAEFLKNLHKRNNFPSYVLDQYKQVLNDYNYKN